MIKRKSKNMVYMLTVEYNPDTEEIEYIAEEIIDDTDLETHIRGKLDMEQQGWDVDILEFMREHYLSGEA
tara:strand:- start:224 stop:433 length:210 start_codon:yes stop_codon:yes gene_type:complete